MVFSPTRNRIEDFSEPIIYLDILPTTTFKSLKLLNGFEQKYFFLHSLDMSPGLKFIFNLLVAN